MAQSVTARPAFFGGRKPLIAALILGAITAGLIVAYLASQESSGEAQPVVGTVQVVVARQEIPVGTTIDRSMVELRELPADALVSGAVTRIADVVGETTRYPVAKGEQFIMSRLVEPPKAKSLSFTIPEGLLGFTVPVEVTKSPAALIVPGDFVDVIVSAEIVRLLPNGAAATETLEGSSDKPKAAVTLLQNVQVLSVQKEFVDDGVTYDESTRGDQSEERTVNYVTLAVTPEQAQLLWLATQEGALTPALRAFGDDTIVELPAVAEPIRLP